MSDVQIKGFPTKEKAEQRAARLQGIGYNAYVTGPIAEFALIPDAGTEKTLTDFGAWVVFATTEPLEAAPASG